MCGRISLFAELGDLASQFRFDPGLVEEAYRASWNIAPTAPVLTVMAEDDRRGAGIMRWGFTFSARRDGGSSSRPLFNARSETLTERPAFRAAFASRRCLVPINGFYEWRNENGSRTDAASGFTVPTNGPSRWPASTTPDLTRRRASSPARPTR